MFKGDIGCIFTKLLANFRNNFHINQTGSMCILTVGSTRSMILGIAQLPVLQNLVGRTHFNTLDNSKPLF